MSCNAKIVKSILAFTLAEVLITLVIIGVVAAMMIPNLVNNVQKQELVSSLKKNYSMLAQAFNMLTVQNNGDITTVITGTGDSDDVLFLNALTSNLKLAKNCGSEMGCLYSSPQYGLDGSQINSNLDLTLNGRYAKAILLDGSCILVDISNKNCADTAGTSSLQVCGNLVIDVNGAKGPNTIGRDYYNFWITKTGIFPNGIVNDGKICDPQAPVDMANRGCAARVLKEGAINY